MNKCTIVYYTGNREKPEFEQKIIDGIKRVAKDIPIVSVSQKPIDLGTNICVGDRGNTYLNAFRQLLIGCKEAKTKYVIMAESDCLYPDTGYFDFVPTDPNVVYTYDNVWVLWKDKGPFKHKPQTHASVIYGREYLINLLENSFKGLPEWSTTKVGFPFYTDETKFVHFTGLPIVSLKTGDGVQKGTRTDYEADELPYWNKSNKLREKIWTR